MAEQTDDRSDRSVSSAKPPGGDLVLLWVVASVAGWLVGWIVAWIGALAVGWLVAWAGLGIGTGVGVTQLEKNAQIEIEAIAVIPDA